MKKLLILFFAGIINLAAQNAADYFPSQAGFKWYFKNTPYDSLNHLQDSLAYFQIDSFATVMDYNGKTANAVLTKSGPSSEILQLPYFDTNFVYTETSNIWNYFKSLGSQFGGFGIGAEGWYNVYRLSSSTSSTYTIFSKDTLVTYDSTDFTLRTEVTGKRLADQVISTPYGMMNCKKFLLKPVVKIIPQIIPIPITILTINDTVYIAPGYYIVRNVRPSANLDLSLLGFPAFYIPGNKFEAIAPPPVLSLDSLVLNPAAEGDTSFIIVSNSGEGTFTWSSEIMEGADWIHFPGDSSGTVNDSLYLIFDPNPDLNPRTGFIAVYGENAFNSPQYVSVFQPGTIIVSINDENDIPREYCLLQNYPNPFNPETNISFSVKAPGLLKLVLYDILGNEIKTIADGIYSPGNYNVKLNSGDLSSGIYIYKLSVNEFTASRKMLILK